MNARGAASGLDEGIWRHGAPWLKPFLAAVPWLTVFILLFLFWTIGGTLTSAKGVLFDLPDAGLAEGEPTGMVALVMPVARETLVFFDDSRFMLGDEASVGTLSEQIAECAARTDRKTMLVLADRRVAGGDLVKFAAIAKKSGVKRILFAEKKARTEE